MPKIAKLATELGWPEGPSVLDDGSVAFVETYRSRISVWSAEGGVRAYADPAGGPNATALGADGALYLTQNGGIVGPWRAAVLCPPSIQRVSSDGSVEVVASELDGVSFQAPNDLAFGPDQRLYFTDPGRFDADTRPDPGYIFALDPDGGGQLLADLGPVYPNGIVVAADGGVIWAESYTRDLVRLDPSGDRATLCRLPEGHFPDGLALARDGRMYVTVTAAGGIDVVSPKGDYVDFLSVGAVATNCAFSGSTLYVTDGGQPGTGSDAQFGGVLWAVELEDTEGLRPFRGEITATAA